MPRFPQAPMGYDRKQVDAFFHRPPAPELVWAVGFASQVDGYDMQAVDNARSELFQQSLASSGAAAPQPVPAPPATGTETGAGGVDIAARVAQANLPVSRSGGYHQQEVDAYLAGLVSGPAPAPGALRSAGFHLVRLRTGYRPAAVDAFLAGLADELERANPVPTPAQQVAAAPSPAGAAAALADRVEHARFGNQRRGYAVEDVDAFLDRLLTSLRGGRPMTAGEVENAAFASCGPFTTGYSEQDVDDFLDEIVAALTAIAGR